MQKKAVVRERLGIMIEWKQMTMQEAENKMEVLREIFDVVRLLKGSDLQDVGMESKLAGRINLCQCYAFWNKDKRCENCISLKALKEKKQTSKIEFLDSDMYQVFARYLEIDSEPYVMEMLKKLDESTLTDEEGYEKLTEKLTVYSEKLYRDVLTGAYNRRYFEEKVKNMSLNAGVAVIDLDDFKLFNDTYGHDGGDLVLTTVVNVIRHYIRRTDILVRYGGDEFLLILPGIEKEVFSQKLRMIQEKIHATHIPGFNRLKLSVSIGGAMFTHGRLEEAITKADRLMYMAKGHKNIVVTRWEQKQNTDKLEKRNLPQLLVVDDSEMNREILKEILGKEYRILEACDGEEALKMLEQYGTEISLVLLDIIMPLLNGMDAAREIRECIPDVKIIFLTSSPEFAVESYDVEAAGYLLKPLDPDKLEKVLLHCIQSMQKEPDSIAVRTAFGYQKIYIHCIEYVEAQNKKVIFNLSGGEKKEAIGTLSYYETFLTCERGFFKCHRSYIVYMPAVDHFTSSEILTVSKLRIPIARGIGKTFQKSYFSYMFKEI